MEFTIVKSENSGQYSIWKGPPELETIKNPSNLVKSYDFDSSEFWFDIRMKIKEDFMNDEQFPEKSILHISEKTKTVKEFD